MTPHGWVAVDAAGRVVDQCATMTRDDYERFQRVLAARKPRAIDDEFTRTPRRDDGDTILELR